MVAVSLKKKNRQYTTVQSSIPYHIHNTYTTTNADHKVKERNDTGIRTQLESTSTKDENQQTIFNMIATDTLAIPYTWETELSALGQTKFENEKAKQIAFAQKWEALIDSKKLGYMALLRNLRNILEANVSANHIQAVCNYLSNAEAVTKSKQLPFRFLAAYRELKEVKSKYTSYILDALELSLIHI